MRNLVLDAEPIGSDSALAALREQIGELQLPQIAHGRRAIILFEGLEGSGKKTVLRQLAAALDPCQFAVHAIEYDRRESAEGHWLARFWRRLPRAGDTAIFYRSWYRRVLDDRVRGRLNEDTVARSFDEINEFEAQQRDYGTLIVKLYFEVSPEVQQQRLADRAASRWPAPHREEVIGVADPAYVEAVSDLMRNSDTRWSPWKRIAADDERRATLSALEAIADAWAKAMPSEPPHLLNEPNRAA
jgi:polyphosphate kinase 2 (PPK2 family)